MFYAHEGSSSDNGFWTRGEAPIRSFKAFDTKAERAAYQDKIWKESNGEKNVIFCTAAFVREFYPRPYVVGNDVYPNRDTYIYCTEMEAQ